jgi:DNA-binding phage protein
MQTQFDRDIAEWLNDPEFAEEYEHERARIGGVDAIVRALDAARVEKGLSKAAVATAAGLPAQSVRRFFTQNGGNPTLWTTIAIAEAVGVRIAPIARTDATNTGTRQRPNAVAVSSHPAEAPTPLAARAR